MSSAAQVTDRVGQSSVRSAFLLYAHASHTAPRRGKRQNETTPCDDVFDPSPRTSFPRLFPSRQRPDWMLGSRPHRLAVLAGVRCCCRPRTGCARALRSPALALQRAALPPRPRSPAVSSTPSSRRRMQQQQQQQQQQLPRSTCSTGGGRFESKRACRSRRASEAAGAIYRLSRPHTIAAPSSCFTARPRTHRVAVLRGDAAGAAPARDARRARAAPR